MTYSQAYHNARLLCGNSPARELAFDLSCLMKHCFGHDRFSLPIVGELQAPPEREAQFFELVRRYADGFPLQYLLGEWEFYGLSFEVGDGVLIPRADTETLVDAALELLKDTAAPRVADVCAGSGCVAAAIAHCRPDAEIYAVELSPKALKYLERNLGRHAPGARVVFGDAFEPPDTLSGLDAVVSNPPYLTAGEMRELPKNVSCEPSMALYGGGDGLRFYRRLPGIYFPLLRRGGHIALEAGYTQARDVAALLKQAGYDAIGVRDDMCGIARVVYGRKPY